MTDFSEMRLAHRRGFEPLTPRFVVWCSIQLSYRCLAAADARRDRYLSAGQRDCKGQFPFPARLPPAAEAAGGTCRGTGGAADGSGWAAATQGRAGIARPPLSLAHGRSAA